MGATGLVTERERWERERLVESLDAYQRGLADAPVVHKHALDGTLAAFADGPVSEGPITFVASDETEDRLGDVLRTGGWDLDAYRRNPVFLWAHDYTHTPVGRSVWVGVEGPRLLSTVVFAPTEFAREVEGLYRQRFLRAVSVGFRAKAFAFRKGVGGVEGIEFKEQELLEISAVPVPANAHALAKALQDGMSLPYLGSLLAPGQARASSADEFGEDDAVAVVTGLRRLREVMGKH